VVEWVAVASVVVAMAKAREVAEATALGAVDLVAVAARAQVRSAMVAAEAMAQARSAMVAAVARAQLR